MGEREGEGAVDVGVTLGSDNPDLSGFFQSYPPSDGFEIDSGSTYTGMKKACKL